MQQIIYIFSKKMNNKLFDEKIKELQNLYIEDIFKDIENRLY